MKKTYTLLETDEALGKLSDGQSNVRVSGPVAKQLLLDNAFVTLGTNTLNGRIKPKRYLRIENLGMGVYEVNIADRNGADRTILLKK